MNGSPSHVCWPHIERLPALVLKSASSGFKLLDLSVSQFFLCVLIRGQSISDQS